jgi:hypothetical protein
MEHSEYARHATSSAILNIDAASFNRYKDERAKILKMDQLAREVNTLQKDMGDIKMLLQQLVNGKTNG